MMPMHLHAEDLPQGATAPAWRWGPLTLTDIVRYAGASGDFTPIHHDPAVAAGLGLDRVFAMGMLTGGLLGRYAAAWLGHERVRRFTVRFHDKTWVGDVIAFSGRVTDVSGEHVETGFEAVATDGRVLARASASAEVGRRDRCASCPAPEGSV
jgi:acyl dehydratase